MPDVNLKADEVNRDLWDRRTFVGRLKYFFWMTDFTTVLTGNERLYEAKKVIDDCKAGIDPPADMTAEALKFNRKLVEASFHPDSGELQNPFGRMSFQVPGGMLITAAMLQFYRTTPAVILWQWVNQSFNAVVNYTNRNAASDITPKQIGTAYVSATSSAVITAISLKRYLSKSPSPLLQRFVPFIAVAVANMINIPLMRQTELTKGVSIYDENNNEIANSKIAAVKGISEVVASRIAMASPGMLLMPVIMEALEKKQWFKKAHRLHMPFQTIMIGCFLIVMVPVGCSLFPQNSEISLQSLKRFEPLTFEEAKEKYSGKLPVTLYFNKGL